MNVYERLSPGFGFSLIRLGNSYRAEGNSQYLAGLDMGAKSVQILFAPTTVGEDVDYEEAISAARTTVGSVEGKERSVGSGEVFAAFVDLYFLSYARRKFQKSLGR